MIAIDINEDVVDFYPDLPRTECVVIWRTYACMDQSSMWAMFCIYNDNSTWFQQVKTNIGSSMVFYNEGFY